MPGVCRCNCCSCCCHERCQQSNTVVACHHHEGNSCKPVVRCSRPQEGCCLIHCMYPVQVLDVVSVADSVTKLAGKCAYCARAALFSLRIAADSRQAVVGGADKYAPVCRRHYRELHQPVALDGDGAEEAGAHAATADGSLASRT